MPVFPSQNLNSQKICESYNKLLQYYDSGIVLDGTGSQVQFLNVTASYALNCNCPSGSGGTTLNTGSTYPITSSWALTASYALNCNCPVGSSVTGSFCSSSIWTFNHNLGNQYVVIQTYDEYNNQLIPEVINLYDENTAIIAFSRDTCGTAVASLGGLNSVTQRLTQSFYLGTGSTYPITSSWALSASWAPCTCDLTGDTVAQQFVSSSTWVFTHNLDDLPVLVQAYDYGNNQIVPSNIKLNNNNVVTLTFPVSESGWAIASRSGLKIRSGSLLQTGSTYPITSSWALYTATSSYIQVSGVTYPVRRIYNNYTVVRTTDYTILCDATSGSFNVVLPNPVGNTNIYNIKKIDKTGHDVHVTVANASYIDYDVTQSISHRGTNMMVQSDGTNQYWIL
jgi:hypothetical protein